MPLETACPHCGTKYRGVPDSLAGKEVRCKSCDQTFAAIAQDTDSVPLPSPADARAEVDSAAPAAQAAPGPEQGSITIVCPTCGMTSADAPARLAGKRVRCPQCGERFVAGEEAPSAAVVVLPPAPKPPVSEEPAPVQPYQPPPAAAPAQEAAPFPDLPSAPEQSVDDPLAPSQPQVAPPPSSDLDVMETQPFYEPPPSADPAPAIDPGAGVVPPPAEPFPGDDPFGDAPLADPDATMLQPPPSAPPSAPPPPARPPEPPAADAPAVPEGLPPMPGDMPLANEVPELTAPEAVDLDIGKGEEPDPLAAEVEAFSTRPIPVPKDLPEKSGSAAKRRGKKTPAAKSRAGLQAALTTALKFLLGPNVVLGLLAVWAPLTAMGLDGVVRIVAAALLGVLAGSMVTAVQTLALLLVFKEGGLRIVGLAVLVPSAAGWLAAGIMGLLASPEAEMAATSGVPAQVRPTPVPAVRPEQQPTVGEPAVETPAQEAAAPTAIPESRDADTLTLALNGLREALLAGHLDEADRLLRTASLLAPSDPVVLQAARDLIRELLSSAESKVRNGAPQQAVGDLERARDIALRFGIGSGPIDAELTRIREMVASPLIAPSDRAAIARLAGRMVEVKLTSGETRKGRLLRIVGDQLEVEAMGEVGPGRMSFNLAIPLNTVEGVRAVSGG